MMSLTHLLVAAALLPAGAIAQQALPDAADPNAATTAPAYVSAFSDYRAAADTNAAPDTVWRHANEQLVNRTEHAEHGRMDMPGTEDHAAAAASGNAGSAPHAEHGNPMAMPGMRHEAAAPKPGAAQPASEAGHDSHHH